MYNAEKTIGEALWALNKQSQKNFEAIVVNDGSTDNSLEIVKMFNAKYPLRIISQKNSGPAAARNLGAKNAKANILIFMDSDCIPREDFVENILEPFKDKEIAGVQGEYEPKNRGSIVARHFNYESYYRHESMKNKNIDHVATYACAYRKKDFGSGFSTKFKKANMEDTELSYRLAKENKKLIFKDNVVVKHPHPSSFFKFMKQQYSRGYWRVPGHMKHPDKLVNDSYLGREMIIQGGLSLLFFFALALSVVLSFFLGGRIFLYPLTVFIILYISNFPFGIYCAKYEKKMLFIAPLIASCRSISATLGFLHGLAYFRILNKFK